MTNQPLLVVVASPKGSPAYSVEQRHKLIVRYDELLAVANDTGDDVSHGSGWLTACYSQLEEEFGVAPRLSSKWTQVADMRAKIFAQMATPGNKKRKQVGSGRGAQ